jgi:peroxiredoxin
MHFRTFRHLVLSIFLSTCFLGCGADSESKPNAAKSPSATGKAEEASKPEPKPVPPRREPALPGMEGRTLEGAAFSLTNYIGKRVLIYFFDAGEAAAVAGAEAVRSIAALQHKNNFQLIGVSTGDNPMQTSEFVGKYQLNFPIVVDSNKVFLQRFRLRESNAIIGMDPEGYFSFIHGVPRDGKNPAQVLEGQLRESLRLPSGAGSATQEIG